MSEAIKAIQNTINRALSNINKSDPYRNSKLGKVYELEVLKKICQDFEKDNFDVRFFGKTDVITFRSSGGPIDLTRFTAIQLNKKRSKDLTYWIFTDVEFLTKSFVDYIIYNKGTGNMKNPRDFFTNNNKWIMHELDILILKSGKRFKGYPYHSCVHYGVECKYRKFNKGLLKEVIGVQKELDQLLKIYCSDPNVIDFKIPEDVCDIQFINF